MDVDIIKPMLASSIDDLSNLKFPLYASVKLDGIRCIIHNGVAYSRSGKPIPSRAVQELFGKQEYEGFDGELIYGDMFAKDCFNVTSSFCRKEHIPRGLTNGNIHLYVFDIVDDNLDYNERYHSLKNKVWCLPQVVPVTVVHQGLIGDIDTLLTYEESLLEKGAEGVMLRNIAGPYKHGRATQKSQDLLKLKRFADCEAEIIGYEELMHNGNEAKTNELGYAERSSHKENLVPMNTLGALVCKTHNGVVFSIGTGYNAAQRKELWESRNTLVGQYVKYRYFPIGVKTAPRFPTFIGIRDTFDTGE